MCVKDTDFRSNFVLLPVMEKLFRYVSCVMLVLACRPAVGQDRRMDECLDGYESLCGQCLDMKSRALSGEMISREHARDLIGSSLDLNKELKAKEGGMTAGQRHRFNSISRWFTDGTPPEPVVEELPAVGRFPYTLVESGDSPDVPASLVRKPDAGQTTSGYRGTAYVLASLSAPDMAYGVMAGYLHKKLGAYAAFRSSYMFGKSSYRCDSNGLMDTGGYIWPSGKERRNTLHAAAGVLVGATRWLSLYAGAGYGARTLAWEDVDGEWAEVSDWSLAGAAVECGVILSWRKLTFSAGVSSISFKTASFTCGVGIRF